MHDEGQVRAPPKKISVKIRDLVWRRFGRITLRLRALSSFEALFPVETMKIRLYQTVEKPWRV